MRKISVKIGVTAVFAVALFAQPVLAHEEIGREYVGETTVSTPPDIGLLALHELCDADFPGARMCSSSDIIRNGARASAQIPAGAAWVHPTLVGQGSGLRLDASGQSASPSQTLSCAAWRLTAGKRATILLGAQPHPTISIALCTLSLPVACCAERDD